MAKGSRALKSEAQAYGQRLAEMAKMHSSEAFYAVDDPLEAAIFSPLVELIRDLEREKLARRGYSDRSSYARMIERWGRQSG